MDNHLFSSYRIDDRSYLSFIKRELHNALGKEGFSTARIGEIDIVISELTSNLIKHANGGELLHTMGGQGGEKFLELITLDDGPGNNDIQRMMRDGVSTSNTLGQGLGAINRLSSTFQIYSQRDWGTVAYSKCLMNPMPVFEKSKHTMQHAVLQVNKPGEKVCGDGFCMKTVGDEIHMMMGDGLGHGPHAHEAVQLAISSFRDSKEGDPAEMLRYLHDRVKKTRGLVATVVMYHPKNNQWKICGVGNIATRLYQGLESKNYMAHNGIIGHNIPNTMNNYIVKDEPYQCIVMCSDGIRSRWDLAKYTSLLKYSPSVIAATIFKDNARRNDDMSVFVGKVNV